ncbi:MAG: tyrosine-type recombinase/integrase [Limisphaerales bacterium]
MKAVNGNRVSKRRNDPLTVQRGSVGIPIYTTRNVVAGVEYLRHEVVWYDADGKRCRQRFSDLDKAKREATLVATKLANCDKETLKLSPEDRLQLVESQELLQPFNLSVSSAIREFVAARQKLPPGQSLIEAADYFGKRNPVAQPSKNIGDIVAEMVEAKRIAGVSDIHLRILKGRLERFAQVFQCPIASITALDISKYISSLKAKDGKTVKNRTRGNALSDLRNFFNFARKQRYITRDVVEEISEIDAPKKEVVETGIFTPAQMKQIIAEVNDELKPLLAIGAFCGLRSEELNRLHWRDVRLTEGVIIVGADKAKTATRRVVPIPENCRAWLASYAKSEGQINPAPHAGALIDRIERVAARLKIKWVKNGLRHSFCSYRLAVTSDPARVATEAGNSPVMVHRHYKALVTEAQAKEWFNIFPKTK